MPLRSISIHEHRFGVNYVPARDWWYCWNDFDADDIRADLDAVAGLAADHIRMMLLWPYFQPNPGWVSPAHLRRLATVMEIAAERELDVCPTLFNGHLTGQQYRPGFGDHGNFYTSEAFWAAQELYLREVGQVLACHGNVLAVDLGNEMNCCWRAQDPAQGDTWMQKATAVLQPLLPGVPIVNGVDHQPWFFPATFTPQALARTQEIVPLHTWIEFTEATRRSRPLEPACLQLAPMMVRLARSFAGDPPSRSGSRSTASPRNGCRPGISPDSSKRRPWRASVKARAGSHGGPATTSTGSSRSTNSNTRWACST